MSGDPLEATPPKDGARFRGVIGILAILGGLAALLGLYFVPVPKENHDALILALGIVLGWGGTVVGFEYGSSPSGRKAADAAIARGPAP